MGSLPYESLPHDDTKGGARRHKLRIPHPRAGYFLFAQKVPKNAPGTPRTPIFCLIGLYQNGDFSAAELGFVI